MNVLELLFYIVFPIIGMIATFSGPPLIVLFWFRWMPRAARTLFWAKRRGQPPALIAHDSGRSVLRLIEERRGEGVVMTNAGRYKILPRYVEVESAVEGLLEQQKLTAKGKEKKTEGKMEGENQEPESSTIIQNLPDGKRIHLIKTYAEWVSRRSFLTGLGLPMFLGYSGTLCLMNPEALALYCAGDMKILDAEGKWLFNPYKMEGKDINNGLEPLMLLDNRLIKTIVDRSYDTSQIAAIVVDAEEVGRLGRGMKKYLPILAILLIMAAVGLGLMFLPQLLSGLGMG